MDDSTDSSDQAPPEVTISPADNGHVVRWHQRSGKKGEPGRGVTRVASDVDEALVHARSAISGGKPSKKKFTRDGQTGSGISAAEGESGSASSPAAHAAAAHPARRPARGSTRRRRSRIGGRR